MAASVSSGRLRAPKQCDTRMVVAAPIDITIMKAQFASVVVIWLADIASVPNHPIMTPVPTKAEPSRNIWEEIGIPMRSRVRISSRTHLKGVNPFR